MTVLNATNVVDTAAVDFIAHGYDRIGEPLNLHAGAQRWWCGIADGELPARDGAGEAAGGGLVLGATTWLGRLLARSCNRVVIADNSAVMLETARAALANPGAGPQARFDYCHTNWLEIPEDVAPLRAVMGDNSFAFLPFPKGWSRLCDLLAASMLHGGRMMMRCLTVPSAHRASTTDEILERFSRRDSLNCTELRATLLFAQWDADLQQIETERMVDAFDSRRSRFEALLAQFGIGAHNDLLDSVLDVLRRHFGVTSVHFGPYALSEHFPVDHGAQAVGPAGRAGACDIHSGPAAAQPAPPSTATRPRRRANSRPPLRRPHDVHVPLADARRLVRGVRCSWTGGRCPEIPDVLHYVGAGRQLGGDRCGPGLS